MSVSATVQRLLLACVSLASAALTTGCLTPPPKLDGANSATSAGLTPPALEPMTDVTAWSAVAQMTPGINIGNTLDNTTSWEVGWGQPKITKHYVQKLAALGYRTIRLPVAWDTYAIAGRIQADKLRRVNEVVDWITGAGMFCVLNIHWDNGWIDSDNKQRYADSFATFSPKAERKFRSYWQQISTFFAGKDAKLIFESLNEETNFANEGPPEKQYATLTRVQQIFIDTVRHTGGNNANRLLIVAGYSTDITKTCAQEYKLPTDTIPGHLFISVHYYTPWQFCGLTEDADWGKVMTTWGDEKDLAELNRLFDMMGRFCAKNDIPAFIGELGVVANKDSASRVRWMSAVHRAAISRKMVPVLWDTGTEISRNAPYDPSPTLIEVLRALKARNLDARGPGGASPLDSTR